MNADTTMYEYRVLLKGGNLLSKDKAGVLAAPAGGFMTTCHQAIYFQTRQVFSQVNAIDLDQQSP